MKNNIRFLAVSIVVSVLIFHISVNAAFIVDSGDISQAMNAFDLLSVVLSIVFLIISVPIFLIGYRFADNKGVVVGVFAAWASLIGYICGTMLLHMAA